MHLRLQVHQLSYQRRKQTLFNNLEFNITPGQCLLIYGANGSGKTSLLKTLAGLFIPTTGSIEWQGYNIHKQLSHYHQDIHFLGHNHGLRSYLSVKENLIYSQNLIGQSRLDLATITHALQQVKLFDHREILAQQLSTGQKRRLALARLIAAPKPLWLLDEPTTNLDQEGIQWFYTVLQQHLAHAGLAIIASHQRLPLEKHHLFQKLYLGDVIND